MTCAFSHHHQPSGDFYEPEAIEVFGPESLYANEVSAAEVNLIDESSNNSYPDSYSDYLTDYYSELAEAYEVDRQTE